MKVVVLAALVLAVSAKPSLKADQQWASFKTTHNKAYTISEEAKRFAIFQDNLEKIETHNALFEKGEVTYTLGVNQFADMTQEEFGAMLRASYKKQPTKNATRPVYKAPVSADIPTSYDWRDSKILNAVKNQGQCGSCWAFSSVAVTESAYAIKNKKLVSLSEQQLVDCATGGSYISQGCSGGTYEDGLGYIKAKGIELESDYAYKAVDQTCAANGNSAVKISNFADVKPNSEDDIVSLVATKGPIGVSMYAEPIQFYNSGIFTGLCLDWDTLVDHAVTAVGYGTENNVDYWIIRNSWGGDWGESGYFRLQRGVNKCDIGNEAAYVEV